MKKNVFEGFSENKIENLGVIHGGYYYRGTRTQGATADNDEELVTEQSDKNIDCTYPGTTTCTDERWDDCTPGSGISNPGTPPVVPPVRTR